MKLRNKKTGKIAKLVGYVKTGDDRMFFRFEDDKDTYKKEYNSLTELERDWEDYEEPKEYWFISTTGEVHRFEGDDKTYTPGRKQIGNYFETREEAEKAVKKLKAWKRLKDKGFRFEAYKPYGTGITFTIAHINESAEDNQKDLDLLFGGEE